jgi:hypothetical protein
MRRCADKAKAELTLEEILSAVSVLTRRLSRITTFQAPSVDRLHRQLGLPFGKHDPQITVTPGTGALEVLGHSVLSLDQAFVHHDPRNLQPEPFRQFFDVYGEARELKAGDFHD